MFVATSLASNNPSFFISCPASLVFILPASKKCYNEPELYFSLRLETYMGIYVNKKSLTLKSWSDPVNPPEKSVPTGQSYTLVSGDLPDPDTLV